MKEMLSTHSTWGVLKSRSANNRMTSNEQHKPNGTTNSTVRIDHNTLRKRGPYVMKEIGEFEPGTQRNQFCRKPRPHRKKFVSKVLQILNKSTLGTQYPPTSADNIKTRNIKNKSRVRIKDKNDSVTSNDVVDKEAKWIGPVQKLIINNNIVDEELVVLRSKKDLITTPSENSYKVMQCETYKWVDEGLRKMHRKISEIEAYNLRRNSQSESDPKVIDDSSKEQIIKILSGDATPEVNLGRNKTIKDMLDINQTLLNTDVSQTVNAAPKPFTYYVSFVDNSYELYHINDDTEEPTTYNETREKTPTINDKIEQMPQKYDKLVENLSDNAFYINDESGVHRTDIINSNPSPDSSVENIKHYYGKARKPHKSRSAKTPRNIVANSKMHYNEMRKRDSEKSRRSFIINSLREQLSVEDSREPQNFFEALRIMARNKHQMCMDDGLCSAQLDGCMVQSGQVLEMPTYTYYE